MRGWLGPAAGQPGTRHTVELLRQEDTWILQRSGADARFLDIPTTLPLPYFPELKVACGALQKDNRLVDARTSLHISTERELHPDRHFLVRASGDSMNGGDHPIADGDLVLCEWWPGGSAAEVNGKPMLIVGHYDSETSFAAMKVPQRKGNGWVLHSWNPNEPDQPLPDDARVEPVARILEVVEEQHTLTLYSKYTRDDIAPAFGSKNDQSWGVGHRDIEAGGRPHTVLMVTLRKDPETTIEHRYADLFVSRDELQWESQATTAPEAKKGRNIIHHASQGRTFHLFARYHKREPFIFCGTVTYLRHTGEAPMRVWWRLNQPLPERLWKAWAP